MKLCIRNAELEGKRVDLVTEGGLIRSIRPHDRTSPSCGGAELDEIIEADGNYLVPSLKNGHTHAAMTLLRGYADDMKLKPWLEEKIWPVEEALTAEDIYWGTRLAAIEMVRTGTTFSNDMYIHFPEARKAYVDSGIKAATGPAMFDFFDEETSRRIIEENRRFYEEYAGSSDTVRFSLAPHSIYTVSAKTLQWTAEFAEEHELPVHIHLSETEKEVKDCIDEHGMRPAEYLKEIGFLGPHTVLAHSIWLSDEEISILAESGATVVHNPASNMKLASGSCFPYARLREAGVPMMLGTDGCSSNNNLDLFEEAKLATLLQKHHFGDTELMSAEEILDIAMSASTSVYPHLSGSVAEGAHADLLLIDKTHPLMVPAFNLESNLVYSGGSRAIDTVICGGEVLMREGRIEGEEDVVEAARERADELHKRVTGDTGRS
jgi:5-methylthioadenosine/S-adenosylhomocysteine deaminase